MGLPPATPSAMAFRMSTSTTNFEPTIFTTIPFMALSSSRGLRASKFLRRKNREDGMARFALGQHFHFQQGPMPFFELATQNGGHYPLLRRHLRKVPTQLS